MNLSDKEFLNRNPTEDYFPLDQFIFVAYFEKNTHTINFGFLVLCSRDQIPPPLPRIDA